MGFIYFVGGDHTINTAKSHFPQHSVQVGKYFKLFLMERNVSLG